MIPSWSFFIYKALCLTFGMSEEQAQKSAAGKIISLVVLFFFTYAVLRYNVSGAYPWKDLAFFIFNKGTALAAYLLISLNFTLGPLKNLGLNVSPSWLNARKALGMTGFLLALIHAFISLMIFNNDFYGKFFEADGSLTLLAGLSMLGGILSLVVLWVINLSFQTHMREDASFIKFITSKRFLLLAFLFGAIHLFFMGYKGWMTPANWEAGLPPISLIGFAVFTLGYIINLIGRK